MRRRAECSGVASWSNADRGHRRAALVAVVAVLAALAACRSRTDPPPQTERHVVWRSLGSWSGHGSRQTESFTSDTGTLRIHWETTAVAAAAPGGTFRLDAHSAISGRLLQPVVDETGPSSGTGYVQQDPHVFYMVVESAQLNWRFTVEEAIEYP